MSRPVNQKLSGYLFIAAGCMFFLAAGLGRNVAFGGVGIAFVVIGGAMLARARRA